MLKAVLQWFEHFLVMLAYIAAGVSLYYPFGSHIGLFINLLHEK